MGGRGRGSVLAEFLEAQAQSSGQALNDEEELAKVVAELEAGMNEGGNDAQIARDDHVYE